MHRCFSESVHFLETYVCLGLRLEPLTIGHRFLLHDIRSPFVLCAERVTRQDLISAVLICAQPYPKALKTIRRGEPSLGLSLFAGTLWHWTASRLDTVEELEKFGIYLVAQQTFPPLRPPKQAGRTLRAPEDWRLMRFLQRIGEVRTIDQALNYPVLRAHALWATEGDHEGWLDLANANDPLSEARTQEFWDWCAEQDRLRAQTN